MAKPLDAHAEDLGRTLDDLHVDRVARAPRVVFTRSATTAAWASWPSSRST
ncbi:MAG: hypothetical protein Q8Q09_10900 [Deltaproteobacteria bacterium]|nr:hypothetical protein [Deltaproteobacteria bacterium]